jgi:hypothetical protein
MDPNGDIQDCFMDDNNIDDENMLNGMIEQNVQMPINMN